MSNRKEIRDLVVFDCKGVTPKYVKHSNTIVLNQKCIKEFKLDYSLAQFISQEQKISEEKYLKVGDIVINSTGQGTAGRCAIVSYIPDGYKVTVDSHMLIIRCLDINTAYILAYNIYLNESYIMKLLTGSSGQAELDKVRLYNINIAIPKNKKTFKDFLVLIQNKIENNNKINEELESMAKTIYDYCFLQFEFPNEEGKPYKSSGGKMVWNNELKREIPEGWKSGRFNDYIQNEKGGDWGKEEKQGNYRKKVTCIRGADFPAICGNQMLKAPIRYILKKNESKILKAGDIIVEISGGSPIQSTGRVCYINPNLIDRFNTDIITSNFCKAFSLKNIEFTYWFYRMWQKLYDSGVYFNYESKTTGIKNLLFETLCSDYHIISPPEEIIKQYNNITTPIFNKIQKNKKENQELADLRDFLLPLLMNGQVGFRELALAED